MFRRGCVQNCAFSVSIQRRHDLMRARSTNPFRRKPNRTEMSVADRYHSDKTFSGCERKHSLLHRWQHIRTSLAQPICLPFATERHAKRAAGLPTPFSTFSSTCPLGLGLEFEKFRRATFHVQMFDGNASATRPLLSISAAETPATRAGNNHKHRLRTLTTRFPSDVPFD